MTMVLSGLIAPALPEMTAPPQGMTVEKLKNKEPEDIVHVWLTLARTMQSMVPVELY